MTLRTNHILTGIAFSVASLAVLTGCQADPTGSGTSQSERTADAAAGAKRVLEIKAIRDTDFSTPQSPRSFCQLEKGSVIRFYEVIRDYGVTGRENGKIALVSGRAFVLFRLAPREDSNASASGAAGTASVATQENLAHSPAVLQGVFGPDGKQIRGCQMVDQTEQTALVKPADFEGWETQSFEKLGTSFLPKEP